MARLWRSPSDQPRWARPALLGITVLAAVAYASNLGGQQPELFYAAAVRSMAHSWHDFFYGAFDPLGTVSVDKLPGALWIQALSVRLFGLHLWAINLPQAVEGALTVPFLYRAVRRLCGARAAICAAFIGAVTPAVVALDRGNVSNSLLILMLVLALDAASAALVSGNLGRPPDCSSDSPSRRRCSRLGSSYRHPRGTGARRARDAAPANTAGRCAPSRRRHRLAQLGDNRLGDPGQDRPYVDGTTNDSVYAQVFEYNGLGRANSSPLSNGRVFTPSAP